MFYIITKIPVQPKAFRESNLKHYDQAMAGTPQINHLDEILEKIVTRQTDEKN